MGWPIVLSCWHISQLRHGLVVQGLSPSVGGLSICCRPLWQVFCCSRLLEWQPCHHGISICSCREAGASTFLPAKPPCLQVLASAIEGEHAYSYQQFSARIDRWLVSDSFLPNVSAASVTELFLSDHYGVAVSVSPANAPPRALCGSSRQSSCPGCIAPHGSSSPAASQASGCYRCLAGWGLAA